jgi:hypothetical protein
MKVTMISALKQLLNPGKFSYVLVRFGKVWSGLV